ncbi:MAG TPA: TIGR03086 family metal-binding protein [Acidimicrobiales bacterium]|nr:TIGR03086 family metal-binding protein [Acidimicrobiales bacterium]
MPEIDLLAALERTYDQAGRVIGAVRDDQWGAPTPCTEWDVRQVVEHLIGTVMTFTNALADTGPAPDGDDPAALFREAAAQSLAAWRQPGALDRTLKLPWGETPAGMAININLIDTAQHTWDVAKATGQPTAELDHEVAEYGREFTGTMIGQMGRGAMFGDEVACPDDAPAPDRLAAFLGRSPS